MCSALPGLGLTGPQHWIGLDGVMHRNLWDLGVTARMHRDLVTWHRHDENRRGGLAHSVP
jgi:hypothetical protein